MPEKRKLEVGKTYDVSIWVGVTQAEYTRATILSPLRYQMQYDTDARYICRLSNDNGDEFYDLLNPMVIGHDIAKTWHV